jgi:RNA polymerase sigma factor (TIGR02999 family)
MLYDELHGQAHRLLSREAKGHTLQTTALLHEAYLRLVAQTRVDWQGRTHFLAIGAQALRRVLVDHARARLRDKRGGGRMRVELNEESLISPERDHDVLAVDAALTRLAAIDERQARVVELRFFAGLTVEEVATALGLSKRTIEGEWTVARAWLRRELADTDPDEPQDAERPPK